MKASFNSGVNDGTPLVVDRDGNSINGEGNTLTLKDLSRMDKPTAPVYDRDAYAKRNLDDLVYFFNATTRDMKIIGTPHRVDKRGQNTVDPDNYDQTVEQDVQAGDIFSMPVQNIIWLEVTIHRPGNTFAEGSKSFTITDPNTKCLMFRTRHGSIQHFVTPQESRDPFALQIENRTVGGDVRVKIFLQNPDDYTPTKTQTPAFDRLISPREHYEFQHIIRFRFWLVEYMQPVPSYGQLDSTQPSTNSVARESATRDFRVGTIEWWAMAKDVQPGMYVFIVSNTNLSGPQYVLVPRNYEECRIIPLKNYLSGNVD